MRASVFSVPDQLDFVWVDKSNVKTHVYKSESELQASCAMLAGQSVALYLSDGGKGYGTGGSCGVASAGEEGAATRQSDLHVAEREVQVKLYALTRESYAYACVCVCFCVMYLAIPFCVVCLHTLYTLMNRNPV
jgi:hypothetical protein